MLIRFVLYGILGWCGEIIWTAIHDKVSGHNPSWDLRGTTYLWMFPIYGLIAPLFEPVHDAIRGWPWIGRGGIYMLGFFTIEYLAGWFLHRLTGACPWDYSRRARWHLHGYIRFDYAPVWFGVGLLLERVHDMFLFLTPAFEEALTLLL